MLIPTQKNLYSSSMSMISLSDLNVEDVKTRFEGFQRDGVINSDCKFDDPVWHTTDEYSNVGLHFKFNLFSYSNNYQQIFSLPFEGFVVSVKAFILSIMGRNALSSIQTVLLDLRHVIDVPVDQVYGTTNAINVSLPSLCGDFFNLFQTDDNNFEIDRLVYAMDAYAEASFGGTGRKQRVLADFDTYLLFNDIMSDFWQSIINKDMRLFFYPLYLWWRLTAVIPLRPRELLLTPRDCLYAENGDYYLKLRRNKLKGSNRQISYKITDDYVVDTYKIPQSLGEDIQRYIEATAEFDDTDIGTLFIADPHYHHWGQCKHSCNLRLAVAVDAVVSSRPAAQ